jgi:hypothetical protein
LPHRLKARGVPASQAWELGYSQPELVTAGFPIDDVIKCDMDLSQLRKLDVRCGPPGAGYAWQHTYMQHA